MSATYLIIATLGHAGIYSANWMSQLLSVMGKPRPVMIINLCRVFLYIIPLCFLGSRFFGLPGLIAGLTLGNLFGGIHAYFTTHRLLAPHTTYVI